MPTDASTTASTPNPPKSAVTMPEMPRHHPRVASNGSTVTTSAGSSALTTARMPDTVVPRSAWALDEQRRLRAGYVHAIGIDSSECADLCIRSHADDLQVSFSDSSVKPVVLPPRRHCRRRRRADGCLGGSKQEIPLPMARGPVPSSGDDDESWSGRRFVRHPSGYASRASDHARESPRGRSSSALRRGKSPVSDGCIGKSAQQSHQPGVPTGIRLSLYVID